MSTESRDLDRYIAIWAKAVETQMHFNEMSVKSRQLGLTFVAAALGVAVVLLSRNEDFLLSIDIYIISIKLHIAVLLILGACLALQAVRQLDLNVYHKMLRGAVAFGEDFEENYLKGIFNLEKGMTQAISHFSRYEDASTVKCDSGKFKYVGSIKSTAFDKIQNFYRRTTYFLLLAAIIFFVITNFNLWTAIDRGSPPETGVAPVSVTGVPAHGISEQPNE